MGCPKVVTTVVYQGDARRGHRRLPNQMAPEPSGRFGLQTPQSPHVLDADEPIKTPLNPQAIE
jgi:hypothetical protein